MIRFLFFAGLRSKRILLTALLLAAFHLTRAQELKLGSNPTVINKASILELESTTRGLLLPRIPDTTVAPLTTAPDGMVIYFTVDSSLYVRKGGAWQKVVDKKYLTGLPTSSGTVTSVSASVPAGMNVTVGTPTTTPSIAITTALNGPLRGTGTGFTTGSINLTSEVSGILPIANGGTGLNTLGSAGQQLRVNPAGTALQYFATTATAPVTYSNGVIGITQASATTSGYLSSTDWSTFNNKLSAIDTTNILNFSVKVRGLFKAGSGLSYDASTGTFTNSAAATYWLYGGNAVTAAQNLGTTSAFDLPIITNNTERMRVASNGRVGIATNAPTDTLTVAGPFRMGINGSRLTYIIRGTVSLGTATNVGGGGSTLDITGAVANATTGATVAVSPLSALPGGISIAYAWVSSAGNVTIRLLNSSVTLVGIPVTVSVPATNFAVTITQ